jgi:ubiquinone/menaquinone biosynthesis C-methylase UbiE
MPLQKDPEGMENKYLDRSVIFTNQRVLEIGSGDGRLTWRYAHSAGRVTAIDPDAQALGVAISGCPEDLRETVSFVRANSINLPFPRETFDIALLSWSF